MHKHLRTELAIILPLSNTNPWGHDSANDSVAQGNVDTPNSQVRGMAVNLTTFATTPQFTMADDTGAWTLVFNLPQGVYNLFIRGDDATKETVNLTVGPPLDELGD